MFYEAIFMALEKHKVLYVVAGGVAVNLHGIPRMTADLDLLVELSNDNLKRLLETMEELGYAPRLPIPKEDLLDPEKRRTWMQEKKLLAFTFWNEKKPIEEIDVLLDSPNPQIFEKAKILKVRGFTVRLISLDDLIAMKRAAGRAQDKADVESLEELRNQ